MVAVVFAGTEDPASATDRPEGAAAEMGPLGVMNRVRRRAQQETALVYAPHRRGTAVEDAALDSRIGDMAADRVLTPWHPSSGRPGRPRVARPAGGSRPRRSPVGP